MDKQASTRRQQKQFVVCLACRGVILTSWAGWIIDRMGVKDA